MTQAPVNYYFQQDDFTVEEKGPIDFESATALIDGYQWPLIPESEEEKCPAVIGFTAGKKAFMKLYSYDGVHFDAHLNFPYHRSFILFSIPSTKRQVIINIEIPVFMQLLEKFFSRDIYGINDELKSIKVQSREQETSTD